MFGSPYYPAGVTDEMIDRYFGDDGSCCEKCEHYLSGDCSRKENALSVEEAEAMTDEEYAEAIHVDADDYCDDFEWKDEGIPDFIEDSWKDERWDY